MGLGEGKDMWRRTHNTTSWAEAGGPPLKTLGSLQAMASLRWAEVGSEVEVRDSVGYWYVAIVENGRTALPRRSMLPCATCGP